ncbi:MAG TPA: hypothetical protein VGX49_04665 [Jatrophihabitans sp.]|jgi:predicted GIY-YIG superfamily endonuclease|nr:hypothetical protein [Jatrophihabitans sp.]
MLATWIRDVYRRDEASDLRGAINDLACPTDYFGFASNGVYIFFNPIALETLYIGLARDLSERFAQHNGLVRMAETGCKKQQIDAWFREHEELGYAMFVQSSLDQVSVHRQAGTPSAAYYDEESSTFWDYPREGLDNIKGTEGILISSYVQRHDRLPPWNKIKGARHDPSLATPGGYALLETAAGVTDSLLVARKTIRGLSADATALHYEGALHTGRIGAIEDTFGSGINSPIIWNALAQRASDPLYEQTGLREAALRILDSGYLLLPPPPPASEETPGRLLHLPGVPEPAEEGPATCFEPDPTEWQLMWTDEGILLHGQMGLEPLRCGRCSAPPTFLQTAPDGTAGAYWCTSHAEEQGAPAKLITLARQ